MCSAACGCRRTRGAPAYDAWKIRPAVGATKVVAGFVLAAGFMVKEKNVFALETVILPMVVGLPPPELTVRQVAAVPPKF